MGTFKHHINKLAEGRKYFNFHLRDPLRKSEGGRGEYAKDKKQKYCFNSQLKQYFCFLSLTLLAKHAPGLKTTKQKKSKTGGGWSKSAKYYMNKHSKKAPEL